MKYNVPEKSTIVTNENSTGILYYMDHESHINRDSFSILLHVHKLEVTGYVPGLKKKTEQKKEVQSAAAQQ